MKILMVCLGNICRSPIAEGILRYKIVQKNLSWEVDSAGTSGWHNGEHADHRSIETASKRGIDLKDQRSRKLVSHDLDDFDIILAMDSQNYNDIIAMSTSENQKKKVELILNYLYPGENRAVPDPYYDGGFDNVYNLLDKAIDQFIIKHSL